MAARDSFLVRIDPQILDAIRRWAADELRSVNGQMEYILRNALADAGRLRTNNRDDPEGPSQEAEGDSDSDSENRSD